MSFACSPESQWRIFFVSPSTSFAFRHNKTSDLSFTFRAPEQYQPSPRCSGSTEWETEFRNHNLVGTCAVTVRWPSWFAWDSSSFNRKSSIPGNTFSPWQTGTIGQPNASRPFQCLELGNWFLKSCAQLQISDLNTLQFNFLDLMFFSFFSYKVVYIITLKYFLSYNNFKTTATIYYLETTEWSWRFHAVLFYPYYIPLQILSEYYVQKIWGIILVCLIT